MIQCSNGSVNGSGVFGDAGEFSLTFITVNVAPYRSAKETTYTADLLESGRNSTGYKMWRSVPVARAGAFFGPTVRTGQGANRKTSSAIEPNNNFLSALRPCVPRTARSI